MSDTFGTIEFYLAGIAVLVAIALLFKVARAAARRRRAAADVKASELTAAAPPAPEASTAVEAAGSGKGWSLSSMRTSPSRVIRDLNQAPPSVVAAPAKEPKKPVRFATDQEFLPAALEILETPPSPVATSLMLAICAMVVAGLTWSVFGWLDIHAVAPGKIQPSGRTKVVQPLEAGRVAAINVESGRLVKEGDVLIELDPTETSADLEALTREHESVLAEQLRRAAAVASAKSEQYLPQPIAFTPLVGRGVREREQGMLVAELDQLRAVIEGLRAQLAERRATVRRLQGSIEARSKLIDLAKERVGMREEIKTRGAGSRALIIDAELQYENYITTDANERGQLIEIDAAISSLERRIEQVVVQFIAEQTQKMIEAERRSERLEQEIIKAKSRSERTKLKAPITGTVQQLDVTSLGQVVSSGQAIMSIVPTDSLLEVEAMIANKDIGFVKPGQAVTVKVEAFPFTRYGTIEGEVVKVSTDAVEERNATAMMDAASAARPQQSAGGGLPKASPGQNLVFPATLRLSKRAIVVDGKEIPLTPGMAVTAEVKTGQRRAISYLLSPLGELLSSSGKER
ncbi:MAG: HlyD family type I secretion periplasmic adaptor subunit [Hyphomicrobiaceae bacterium]|nr:HlyD family type I secretion periplasmic adaptor subunit [Hyphomicrobiaceae bacterium]